MLRNILANPSIRYLALTGTSLTDSDEALIKFFKNGVDTEWKIIGNGGQIDLDLPIQAIEDIRANVKLFDLRGTQQSAESVHQIISQLKPLPPFAEPRIFPKTSPTTQSFPSEFVGFNLRQNTIIEAWLQAIWIVMFLGETSPTDYGLQQKEVLALLSVIDEPLTRMGALPIWAPFKSDDVEAYLAKFFQAEERADIAYNYGHRLQSYWSENQIELIANELHRSGHSRRAVANLWDSDNDNKSADPPCLITIQAAIRNEHLHLSAYIRSNDIFRAYPLNAASLAALQAQLAGTLAGVKIGTLSILSFSAHIYSDCWNACHDALRDAIKLQTRFEQDPRGSFVFRFNNNELIADHYSPAGDLIQTLTAPDAKSLGLKLISFISRVDHALYIGREITRLQYAKDSATEYRQDRTD